MSWRDRSLLDLLTEHGLEHMPEHEFPNDGWSGATFTSLVDVYGRRFVLKRTSLTIDWIARATHDDRLREGWLAALAAAGAVGRMPRAILPYLGAATDGDGVAILTPDLSNELIAWERPGHDPAIDRGTLALALTAVARLHASGWAQAATNGADPPPWCPLAERLTLLAPAAATRYAAEGNPVGERFLAGWAAFGQRASSAARDLIDRLGEDPAPLVTALAALPSAGLHGDLKLANVALLPDQQVGFIDWQMTLRAPIAVELGWFIVSNSGALPAGPEEVMLSYRDAIGAETADADALLGDWDRQMDLAWIVGLLLRGWRKGLDAELGVTHPSGVPARDDLAWWAARAVEAADRQL